MARLEPSRLHLSLLLGSGVLSLACIAVTGLPMWLTVAAIIITVGMVHRISLPLRQVRYLSRLDDGHWLIVDETGRHSGALQGNLFRTASLIILKIRDSNGRRHSIPIWNDSLSPTEFSYLHCQLMQWPR